MRGYSPRRKKTQPNFQTVGELSIDAKSGDDMRDLNDHVYPVAHVEILQIFLQT